MSLKNIYTFEVLKKVKKEVIEETAEGKLTKEIEVEEPVKIIIKKPSRQEAEDADTVYAIEYGRCVRLGMLTNALIDKMYANENGFLSKEDQNRYSAQYVKFLSLQSEYQLLNVKNKKTKKEEERLKQISQEWFEIERDLQELQATRNDLFRNSAETKARDKTITWLVLFLTYIQEDGQEPRSFFIGFDEAQKLEYYDRVLEDEDEFNLAVVDKASLYISLWYMGKLTNPEDFKNFENLMVKKDLTSLTESKEESSEKTKVEEKPTES